MAKKAKKTDWHKMVTRVDGFSVETNQKRKERAARYYVKEYKVKRTEPASKESPKSLLAPIFVLLTIGALNIVICPAACSGSPYLGGFVMIFVIAMTVLSMVICPIIHAIMCARRMPNNSEDRRYSRAINIQSVISLMAGLVALTTGIYQGSDMFLPYLAVFAAMLAILVVGYKNKEQYNMGALFATYVTSAICIFMALFPIFANFVIISELQYPWLCFGLAVSPIIVAAHLRLKQEQAKRTKAKTILAIALCVVAIVSVVANSLLKDNCQKRSAEERSKCWYCLNF